MRPIVRRKRKPPEPEPQPRSPLPEVKPPKATPAHADVVIPLGGGHELLLRGGSIWGSPEENGRREAAPSADEAFAEGQRALAEAFYGDNS